MIKFLFAGIICLTVQLLSPATSYALCYAQCRDARTGESYVGGAYDCDTQPSISLCERGTSSYDPQQARRRAAAAAAAAEAARRAQQKRLEQAQLDRERRETDKRIQMDQARRRQQFIENRNSGVDDLKTQIGTNIMSNRQNAGLLNPINEGTGIKGLKPVREARDLGGVHAAWKQLNCAAAIAGDAFDALRASGGSKPDYDEFSYLATQSMSALNGERLGVQCPTAPPLPTFTSKDNDFKRGVAAEKRILKRATEIVGRMKQRDDHVLVQNRNKSNEKQADSLEKVRQVQAKLDRVNSTKIKGHTQKEINQQEKDRKELTRLILANDSVKKGDFTSISVDIGDDSQDEKPSHPPHSPAGASMQ